MTDMQIPPFVLPGNKILIRGTIEWEQRELQRKLAGKCCLSFGSIDESIRTQGKSAQTPQLL